MRAQFARSQQTNTLALHSAIPVAKSDAGVLLLRSTRSLFPRPSETVNTSDRKWSRKAGKGCRFSVSGMFALSGGLMSARVQLMRTAPLQSGSPIFYLSSLPPITVPRLLPEALITAHLGGQVMCSAAFTMGSVPVYQQDTCPADHLEMASRQE